ncbi:eukaryotic translation initiation factor 2-alpha kinase isoform X1 [Pieris rapae]|uniref:eukaryotic translation initiation factor 2-alpha kinase isoform X1 n=1 Tax=Pieris rapae TaxID=64459 RepID=UPI001E27FB05|nr:eukaryotic translation initiation factor 2-alpha kinase isoform X1 [Pieris rapae]
MSDWYWRVIAFKAAFVLTCFVSYLKADETIQKLPFCNPHTAKDAPVYDDLVLVSTIDGRLSAFSTDNGNQAWALDTQPLLSSTLHHVELTSGGKWVRLVPSLRGTLYSLSGDTLEPLPFNADQLLSSSFKYSDDLVIAGARETLWLGIDAHSGATIYECGSSGCNTEQQTASSGRDILVLRRHSSTVRALDPRSGTEKWNFSVAEHQLAMSRRECVGKPKPSSPLAIAVALPEGVVAVRHPESHILIWQHKLEAPVANMWRVQGGVVQHMDVLWQAAHAVADVKNSAPSLYLGIHNTQLYIQESALYAEKLATSMSTKPLPWKVKQSRPLIGDDKALQPLPDADQNTLSIVSLYGNTGVQDNQGFFLYLQDTCDQAVQVSEDALPGPEIVLPNISDDQLSHHHVHVHVYSLWFWWKEVLLIAISSALLMNLLIWPRFFAAKIRPITPLPVNQEVIVVERHYERQTPMVEYSGRYENDFTPLRCLGRGGFGVVFEARNNIDHCSYAVKRITLPRRESRRERVLREVRALAKLEHEHIVRYFNAWLEEPPLRWQEERDAYWLRELGGISMGMSEDCTSPLPRKDKSPKGDAVTLNIHKSVDDCIDALDFGKKLGEPKRLRSLSCNDSFSIIFDDNASKDVHVTSTTPKSREATPTSKKATDDDSFIVFANSEHSKELSEARDVTNKKLDKIMECDGYSKGKKKKGHTRHWSLDMVVRSNEETPQGSKMYLYIQMQLCLRDSLHDWLRNNRSWESRRDKVKTLFSQIVSAVEYVHLAGLIHRDLKPSNIFFAPDGKVKVGDFGLVTAMGDNSQDGEGTEQMNMHAPHTYRVGTHLYMSPEQLLGLPYSYKVDIYSLGLVLFELLHPFGTESERVSCLMRLRDGQYPNHFQQNYPNETEVLKLMLSSDPNQRPTASGVKARAPLYQATDEQWHFTLPTLLSG